MNRPVHIVSGYCALLQSSLPVLSAFIALLIGVGVLPIFQFLQKSTQKDNEHLLIINSAMEPITIYVTQNPQQTEQQAVKDLQRILGQLFGTEPVIRKESMITGARGIYVGETRLRSEIGEPLENEWDQIVIQRSGQRLLLYGQDPNASALAVYAWLRDEVGVRWYYPDLTGEVIPEKAEIALAQTQPTIFRPSFYSRDILGVDPLWAMRNGLREHFWQSSDKDRHRFFNHGVHLIFTQELFDEHPDVFALKNGQRQRPHSSGYMAQPDLSNPKTAEIASAAALAHFEKFPEDKGFSIALYDTYEFGEYPSDFPHFDPTKFFRGMQDYSDTVFAFANAVADQIAQQHPDKFIGTLSYANYENVPTFPVASNVVPYMTADRGQWYDPNFKEQDLALTKKWVESGPRIVGTWNYFYGRQYLIPRTTHSVLIESIQSLHRLGVRGYFTEMSPIWGFDTFKAWMMASLLWDAELDTEAATQRFFEDMYGPAADFMIDFFNLSEECWMRQPPPAFWLKYYANPHQVNLFTREDLNELEELLQRAQDATNNPYISSRIDHTREALSVTKAFWLFQNHLWEIDDLRVDSEQDFNRLLNSLETHRQLRDSLLLKAQRQANEFPLNQNISHLSWVFRASPISKLAKRGVDWIRSSGDTGKFVTLYSALDGLEGADWATILPALYRANASPTLNRNTGFEEETGWQLYNVPWEDSSVGITSEVSQTGSKSFKFYQSGYTDLFQLVRATRNMVMHASVNVKSTANEAAIIRLDIIWLDQAMNEVGSANSARLPPSSGDNRYELSVIGLPPRNAAFARIRLMVRMLFEEEAVFADNFEVRQFR